MDRMPATGEEGHSAIRHRGRGWRLLLGVLRAAKAKVGPAPLVARRPPPTGDEGAGFDGNTSFFATLLRTMAEGVVVKDTFGRIVFSNPAADAILGSDRRTPLAASAEKRDCVREDGTPFPRGEYPTARSLQTGLPQRGIVMGVSHPRRGRIWINVNSDVVEMCDGHPALALATFTEITESMATRHALEGLNRVLRTMGAGNEVLIRSTDEGDLLRRMCETIVVTGGYRMAWVGLAEEDAARTVRPVAWAGAEEGYLSRVGICWDDGPRGSGPTGLAIRTGSPQLNRDTADSTAMTPWREAALGRGYRSSISLPLSIGRAERGCLTIYADRPDAFNDEEIQLFTDLANDLAFGVAALRERRRREEMERRLHQVQKMEALGQLAGSVAHDFNNLLGAILGFARFILEDAGPEDPNRHHAARILVAGRRGKALVGQILSFARRGEMKREPFALADLMGEIQAMLNATIPTTTRVVVGSPGTQAVLTGDRDQLTQVVLNLAMNAHDALDGKSGTMTILAHPPRRDNPAFRPRRRDATNDDGIPFEVWQDERGNACAVAGTLEPSADHIVLAVSDTGCGMDARVLSRVFDPFFTTKAKGSGTGLGLSVVLGIVLAHGGAVAVESRLGFGTAVEIILPCAADAVSAAPADDRKDCVPAPLSGRILLVDDDPDFGQMLLAALERRGLEVSPCSDPFEALAGIREHGRFWDAVVTDQTMPGMTGMELIREIKALQPDLPCVLCTGYAEDALDASRLRRAGAWALLRKPVEIDDLVEVLARVISESAEEPATGGDASEPAMAWGG